MNNVLAVTTYCQENVYNTIHNALSLLILLLHQTEKAVVVTNLNFQFDSVPHCK